MRWSRVGFVLAFGCGDGFSACEIDVPGGLPLCVERGSDYHETEMDGGSCEDAGGFELKGSCEDNDYTCPTEWGDGVFVSDLACPNG